MAVSPLHAFDFALADLLAADDVGIQMIGDGGQEAMHIIVQHGQQLLKRKGRRKNDDDVERERERERERVKKKRGKT